MMKMYINIKFELIIIERAAKPSKMNKKKHRFSPKKTTFPQCLSLILKLTEKLSIFQKDE
jgi:hypothetical protein